MDPQLAIPFRRCLFLASHDDLCLDLLNTISGRVPSTQREGTTYSSRFRITPEIKNHTVHLGDNVEISNGKLALCSHGVVWQEEELKDRAISLFVSTLIQTQLVVPAMAIAAALLLQKRYQTG